MDLVLTLLLGVAVAVFGAALTYAAVSDLRSFQIPNWVSGVIAASFLIAAAASTMPWEALAWNLVTGLAVLAIGFGLFAAGYFGAGDVKLLSAAALWMGWPLAVSFIVYMVMAGGILSLSLIIFRRFSLCTRLEKVRWIEQLHERKKDVPYGVAISMTALFFLPRIPIVADALLR